MRILMLAQFYPPIIGGVERHVHNLCIELASRGHDVSIATLWQEDLPVFEYDCGVRIYRIRGSLQRTQGVFSDQGLPHSPPFVDPEVLWTLRRIIIREQPQIVHAHNWMVHSFTPLKAWSNAKLVVTLHDCSQVCAKKAYMFYESVCDGPDVIKCLHCASAHYGKAKGISIALGTWLAGKVERRVADIFLPVSRAVAAANQLDKCKVPYRIIPNFIQDEMSVPQNESDPRLTQLPEGDYLLFVGNLVREKGIEILLRAYSEMKNQMPLLLIGRKQSNSPSNFPPNIQILQSWPHTAVMYAWSRCTIALMPSVCLDACPTVAMEAMAMGKPIIASRIGGLAEIVVDGGTGILVPPGNERALREAIERLAADPLLRERMGNMAKRRVVEFQARVVVSRIEEVYQEILQA